MASTTNDLSFRGNRHQLKGATAIVEGASGFVGDLSPSDRVAEIAELTEDHV